MLDLQPRVHFHEPEAVGLQAVRRIGDELDRARADIADGLRGLHRRLAHRRAHRGLHARRGRFLDHLLVAALQRAIALEQMDGIAVAIGEHLHFDVARARDVFLDQHAVVAERRFGFALGAFQRRGEIRRRFDLAHALAAAAGDRLDQNRIADLARFLARDAPAPDRRRDSPARPRRRPSPSAPWRGPSAPWRGSRRAAGRRRSRRPWRRLRRIPHSRTGSRSPDGSRPRRSPSRRRGSHRPQIAFAHRRGTDAHGLVGHRDMRSAGIGIGIDGNRRHAHPARGADDAAGDLAAIGDEQGGNHAPVLCNIPGPDFQSSGRLIPAGSRRSISGCRRRG